MTFEDAARLNPDKSPGELDRGEFVPMTKNTWRHGEIVVSVSGVLKAFARRHPGWSVAAGDPGMKLGHDPDILRGPDVALLRSERRPAGTGAAGWVEGAPELVVEVLGDADRPATVFEKALEYLKAGSKVVWIIDGAAERLMVVTPPDHFRIVGREETIDGGADIPGLSCQVAELLD